jgi:hypothetical protein
VGKRRLPVIAAPVDVDDEDDEDDFEEADEGDAPMIAANDDAIAADDASLAASAE